MYKVVILKNCTVKVMKIRVISLRTSENKIIRENYNFFYFFLHLRYVIEASYLVFIVHGTKISHNNVIIQLFGRL
jgi:hypothetical protein